MGAEPNLEPRTSVVVMSPGSPPARLWQDRRTAGQQDSRTSDGDVVLPQLGHQELVSQIMSCDYSDNLEKRKIGKPTE